MTKFIHSIYFSPTKTTQRVLQYIAKGIGNQEVREIDLTKKIEGTIAIENSIAVIGIPVYSGRIPVEATNELKKLRGIVSKAVLVAVYGNRHYDDALLELKDITEEQGFKIIAAAAFIGEHSFSSDKYPIAANRPDKDDLLKAEEFGRHIKDLLDSGREANFDVPGNRPYKDLPQYPAVAPVTDEEKCNKCGVCVDVCPTDAISLNGKITTDAVACIKCCACVKECPSQARYNDNDFFKNAGAKLHEMCSERKEPEYFFAN